jgi:hypothetical protein
MKTVDADALSQRLEERGSDWILVGFYNWLHTGLGLSA